MLLLLNIRCFKFDTKCDVPESRELSEVALIPRGESQSVSGREMKVQSSGSQGGNPTSGLQVAGPVLRGLDSLSIDAKVRLDDVPTSLL